MSELHTIRDPIHDEIQEEMYGLVVEEPGRHDQVVVDPVQQALAQSYAEETRASSFSIPFKKLYPNLEISVADNGFYVIKGAKKTQDDAGLSYHQELQNLVFDGVLTRLPKETKENACIPPEDFDPERLMELFKRQPQKKSSVER